MGIEIERKFLVDKNKLPPLKNGQLISQGYIQTVDHTAVRARIKGDKGYLTIKGKGSSMTRPEYEYEIPLEEAREIIQNLCTGQSIEKTRYIYQLANHVWEIDVFSGDNAGLIIAEVELSSEEEKVDLPDWVQEEITGQARFYNMQLVKRPYKHWK